MTPKGWTIAGLIAVANIIVSIAIAGGAKSEKISQAETRIERQDTRISTLEREFRRIDRVEAKVDGLAEALRRIETQLDRLSERK